ncbi:AraC family transcriptional regulator [Paenibacillus ottowii]|nr:AraC family transcriptional regulator [Paenibacillus ottowii]MDP1510504.1 AraC family transcriptional regulator [Paenibacillus ottowii]
MESKRGNRPCTKWNEMVQLMIDWIDNNLTSAPSLLRMSDQLGYSPYYCTKQFHSLTGMTLRDYVWMRRISRAALELQDSNVRILDIAVKYGFSSHEAFTRAFVKAFEVSPAVYRKNPRPIPLAIRAEVFSPYHYHLKEPDKMVKEHLQEAEVKIEHIPAHKFIGIWDISSRSYGDFWRNGHNCDEICGTLESMSHLKLPGNWVKPQAGSIRMVRGAICMEYRLLLTTLERFQQVWSAETSPNQIIWCFSTHPLTI